MIWIYLSWKLQVQPAALQFRSQIGVLKMRDHHVPGLAHVQLSTVVSKQHLHPYVHSTEETLLPHNGLTAFA